MDWKRLKDRFLPALQGSTAPFTMPAVILEIEPDFVAGAGLEGSGRSLRRLKRMEVLELESRCFEPLANRPNITNESEFHRAVREVGELVGNGNSRCGLVIPDPAVRVGVLSFETLPDNRREAEALVRWRMKENLPFAPEEARLSYQVLWREPARIEVLVVAAKNSVLAEYESALEHMNGGAVLILPATLALLPLLSDQDEAGQLLVHICCGWVTTVVVAGSRLRLWRTREVGRPAAEDLVREVTSEMARVLASSRDHMKVDIGRVRLCARPPTTPALGPEVARLLSREVEVLAPGAEMGAALPGPEKTLFENFGATIAGVVANAG